MNILNLYYSQTGNTEKIARRIEKTLSTMGLAVTTVCAARDLALDLLSYELAFVGSGVYQWLPGKPMLDFLRRSRQDHSDAGAVVPCAPRRPGKKAVVYCTYAGVHTGINEAVPAVKFTGQLFDHLGFTILDEWYFLGDFKAPDMAHHNTGGRFGDITGRPDERDLQDVAARVRAIAGV